MSAREAARLMAAARARLPQRTVLRFARSVSGGPGLHVAESQLLAELPPGRRQDFALGRCAAAQCLRALGRPGPVLASGRMPRFPDGVRASISHRDGLGVCLAAAAHQVRAIGVDVELAEALPLEATRLVCTDRERGWLDRHPAPRGLLAVLFSLKESIYKARCALDLPTRNFKEIEIPPHPTGPYPGHLTVGGLVMTVGVLESDRLILTWAVVAHD
ncbi:4'-phosphopantetheinyl transferase superfamily protein [Streptomyces sp. NPDC006372]|uniref:4'-phosphopantetheinyl transferase family protein n=1 Tax=Streptomyces sp. NPDC006372 TaxID=3155599 RepID=UPI0033A778F6